MRTRRLLRLGRLAELSLLDLTRDSGHIGGALGPTHADAPACIPRRCEDMEPLTRTADHYARHGHAARHQPRQQSLAPGAQGAMLLMDLNILVYAHRESRQITRPSSRLGLGDAIIVEGRMVFELVLSGFIRVVTHPKVFERPTPLGSGPGFRPIRKSCCAPVTPQEPFQTSHAALAIASGCDRITTDKGFLCITCYRLLGRTSVSTDCRA